MLLLFLDYSNLNLSICSTTTRNWPDPCAFGYTRSLSVRQCREFSNFHPHSQIRIRYSRSARVFRWPSGAPDKHSSTHVSGEVWMSEYSTGIGTVNESARPEPPSAGHASSQNSLCGELNSAKPNLTIPNFTCSNCGLTCCGPCGPA